jgi:hypothetical protein
LAVIEVVAARLASTAFKSADEAAGAGTATVAMSAIGTKARAKLTGKLILISWKMLAPLLAFGL